MALNEASSKMETSPPQTSTYQAVLDEPFTVTLSTGMKRQFQTPISFGALAEVLIPNAASAVSGRLNGVPYGPSELVVSGGYVQFDAAPETEGNRPA